MGVLLILPILVSGYILSLSLLKYRINTYKFEGQLLYLHVARLGMICLLLSTVLVAFACSLQEIRLHRQMQHATWIF
jgi:hypothetical protein